MKEYFSHDYNARNDKKITKLFMNYGTSGIGIYWCIIEMLYEESGYLNIDEYERISFELRVDYDVVKSIVETFDLFENDGIKFWSNSAIERITERMNKSEKARESVLKRWNKTNKDTNVLQTNDERNTNKVKESKEKENKVNILFDDFWNIYDKKVGDKKRCFRKWHKLTDEERFKIMDILPIWKKQFSDKQFQPHPETFLNQERWNDEIEVKQLNLLK